MRKPAWSCWLIPRRRRRCAPRSAPSQERAVDVTADDGVRHELWVIDDEATITALTGAVDALPALYIADGHHRSAAALRVATREAKRTDIFLPCCCRSRR